MQQDTHRTNAQLLEELSELRQRNIELESLLANSKEAEENIRAVSETALDAVIISDQDGNIVFWNKTATEIFGYEKEEVLGNPITMLISDEAMGEYNEGKEHVLERGFSLFGKNPRESVAKRKDGTKFSAEFTVSNWKIKDKYYFGGSLRDISAQKRIEEESERILNMSQDLICIAAADGYFKYVNPAWERILGYPTERLLSRPFLDFIHPEDHQKNDDEVVRLVAGKLTVDFENRYIHKDGTIRIFSWTAAPLPEKGLWYCIGRDVTERKQHEEALKESEERFRAVVESSSDAILITDQNGTIIYWNRASVEMFGYEEKVIVGKSYTNLLPERLRDQDQKGWQQFFKTGVLSHNKIPFATLALRKNGSEFPIEITFSCWKAQGYYCFSFIMRDITERKQAEEALENSESRYRELFNNSKNALVIYEAIDDGRDFIFKEFNHAAENIEQLKKKALIGKFLTEAFPGVKEFGLMEVLRRVWKTGNPEDYPVAFYQDKRISGWRDNYAYKLPSGEIVVIYEDVTERKRMEHELLKSHSELEKKVKQRTGELAKANKELQSSRDYLKKYAGMLLSVREEERRNISTTLHDELGAMAISVDSPMSIAKEEVKDNNRNAAIGAIEQAQAALRKAVGDLRRLAVDLRPPSLEIMGLTAALTDYFNVIKKHTTFKISFRNDLAKKKIPEDMAIVIYRVIQEALNNITRHAKANKVSVRLYPDKDKVHLDITDDGVGFDIDKVSKRRGKLKIGIQGMRERVESLEGEFSITSAPKRGTQIKATLAQ